MNAKLKEIRLSDIYLVPGRLGLLEPRAWVEGEIVRLSFTTHRGYAEKFSEGLISPGINTYMSDKFTRIVFKKSKEEVMIWEGAKNV